MIKIMLDIGIIVFYVLLIKRLNEDLSYQLKTKMELICATIVFAMIGFFTLIPNYFLAVYLNLQDTIPHLFIGCRAMGGGKDGPYITQYLIAWALLPLIVNIFTRSKPKLMDDYSV